MRGAGGGEKGREEGEVRRGEAREREGSGGAEKGRGDEKGEAKRRSEEMSRCGAIRGGTWSR